MTKPTTFETSWQEAERRSFEILLGAAGSIEGRDAFLGANPGIINGWHLEPLPIGESQLSLLAPDCPAIYVKMLADGIWLKRDAAMSFAMRLLKGLPVERDESSNVACLRVRSISGPEREDVDFKNEKAPVQCWRVSVVLDLAFETGGKTF